MRIASFVIVLLLSLPQLALAQYGDPEAGYTAPASAQPVAPPPATTQPAASGQAPRDGGGGIRLGMQFRLAGENTLDGGSLPAISVVVTPGLRLASNKLFIGLGIGWGKENSGGNHEFTIAPTATYDIIQRTNAALHLLFALNMSDRKGGDLRFGMNFGLGVRALLGESFGIGTEWGFVFTQLDGGPPDTAFGFFGALMLESTIGL